MRAEDKGNRTQKQPQVKHKPAAAGAFLFPGLIYWRFRTASAAPAVVAAPPLPGAGRPPIAERCHAVAPVRAS